MKQTRQKSQLVSVVDDPLIMDWWIRSWQGHNVNLPRTTSNTRCAHWSCGGTWCTAQWASDWCYSGLFPRNRMRSIYSPEVEPSFYLPHFFSINFKCPSNGSLRMSIRRTSEVLFPAMRCTHRRWLRIAGYFFALPRFVVAVTISTILVSWRILPKDLWGWVLQVSDSWRLVCVLCFVVRSFESQGFPMYMASANKGIRQHASCFGPAAAVCEGGSHSDIPHSFQGIFQLGKFVARCSKMYIQCIYIHIYLYMCHTCIYHTMVHRCREQPWSPSLSFCGSNWESRTHFVAQEHPHMVQTGREVLPSCREIWSCLRFNNTILQLILFPQPKLIYFLQTFLNHHLRFILCCKFILHPYICAVFQTS